MERVLLALGLTLAGCVSPASVEEANGTLLTYGDHQGAIDYTGTVTGLTRSGPPITTDPVNIYIDFYGTFPVPPEAALHTPQLVQQFVEALSGSPLASVLSTFDDGNGHRVSNRFNFDRSHVYFDSGSQGSFLTWSGVGAALGVPISKGVFPVDTNAVYFLVSGVDVEVLKSDNTSVCTECAWHSTLYRGFDNLPVAVVGHPGHCPSGSCNGSFSPNLDPAGDKIVADVWHELAEALTDSGKGYTANLVNTNDGENEVGDLCGPPASAADSLGSHTPVGALQLDLDYGSPGTEANVNLGGIDYHVQGIWQNSDRGGCVRRLMPNFPAAAFGANTTSDIDDDGLSDLLMRPSGSDELFLYHLESAGTTFINLGAANRHYEIYGFADFTKDHKADILWRDLDDNHLSVWTLDGNAYPPVTADKWISLGVPRNQLVKGVGDFDGDGHADILFLNVDTNVVRVWFNGDSSLNTTFVEPSLPPIVGACPPSDANWEAVGTGDFLNTGAAQMLWRDVNHSLTYHLTRFSSFGSSGHVATTTDISSPIPIIGIADVDGNGTADLIGYYSDVSGPISVAWMKMNPDGTLGTPNVVSLWPGNQWRYSGGGTFADEAGSPWPGILWRNRQTGDIKRWLFKKNPDGSLTVHKVVVIAGEDLSNEIVAN
jgi:hypothetical protein